MATNIEATDILMETINNLSFVAADVVYEQLYNELPHERVWDIASRVQYEIVVAGCNFVRGKHGLSPIEESYEERRKPRRRRRGRPRKDATPEQNGEAEA